MQRMVILMVGLVLVLALPALAEEDAAEAGKKDAEAMEILKKVDTAAKEVDSVRYKASATPGGVATNFFTAAEGTAVLVGWSGAGPEKFMSHVKSTKQGTEEAVELTGGGDGDTFFLIDHISKKAYEDMDPGVLGSSGNTLQAMGMMEFVHNAPFDDELGADEVNMEGKETVNGVECYKIHIVYAGGTQESTWFFSTEDYLPRKRVQHFTIPQQGEGTLERNVIDLEVNPDLNAKLFKLELPEGYEQVDDFAP